MRLLSPFMLALGLLALLIFLLFPRGAPPIAHAQSVAVATITSTHTSTTTTAAAAAAHSLYLPLIHRGGSQTPPLKTKSGIHLGNRGHDWREELFTWIMTDTVTGTWPAAVVVLSSQIYSFTRPTATAPDNEYCRITAATPKLTGTGEPYNAFHYLAAAARAGTKIIIRITPSPGNFVDYADPGDNHTLLATTTPAGGDYCGDRETQQQKVAQYRDILDIAQEMQAIYTLNRTYDWPADSFFFEPANEPNYEWYEAFREQGKTIDPNVDNKDAWIEMDEYFAALYDQAKTLNAELQILTPPMSQRLFGEHFGLGSCDAWTVVGGGQHSGLDFMKKTFGYDFAAPTQPASPKADGFSLHNYWEIGQEQWETNANVSLDFFCDYAGGGIRDIHIPSDHISQHLPDGIALTMRLSGKPIFISEADLLSPCQYSASTLLSKDRIPGDLNDYPVATAQSLQSFIEQEYAAHYTIAWLLTNEYAGDGACTNPNTEINWHEIYRETGAAREWFQRWWPDTQ